ncbi:MAG: hypothetical protein IPM42_18760 [Saprospiraceae bacterium]|nr:hypothetical protein [Saprospiraceae bacterium]
MRKIYHLSTCDTCRKILMILNTGNVELVDIKKQNISSDDLDLAAKVIGSYEALFNKRAQKLKTMTKSEHPSTEDEFRKLILEEYTFLKRPLAIIGNKVFAGNAPKTVAEMKEALENQP